MNRFRSINGRNKKKVTRVKMAITFMSIAVGLVYVYTHMIIPSYPKINEKASFDFISNDIERHLMTEAKNYQRGALSGGPVSKDEILNFRDAGKNFINKLEKCNNKECLIESYNNFMDNYASAETKAITRYKYMHNLGPIGQVINDNFSWSY